MRSLHCSAALALLAALYGGVPARADTVSGTPLTLSDIRARAVSATPDATAFLSKTIQYQSVEDFGTGLKQPTRDLLQFVVGEAAKMGFRTRLAADGLVGVLEYGEGSETIGVLVHLDVVPAEEHGAPDWTYPPFSGRIADGQVWGRGAQDDKGALAATLYAAKMLIDNKTPFKRRLRVILGTKEEKSFEDLTLYFSTEKQPDLGIVPDGVYFITGEKGIADIDVEFPAVAADAGRRKPDRVVAWSGGSAINSVPDFSYMIIAAKDPARTKSELAGAVREVTAALAAGKSGLFFGDWPASWKADLSVLTRDDFIAKYGIKDAPPGDLVLVSNGQAIHGSEPWLGRNAITEVALVAHRLDTLADSGFTRAATFVATRLGVDVYGGGLAGPGGSGIPLSLPANLPPVPPGLTAQQYLGTTVNLGLVGTTTPSGPVTLALDFRTGLGNSPAEALAHTIAAATATSGVTHYAAGVGSHYESFYYPGDNPLMKMAVDTYREIYPDRPPQLPYMFLSPGSTYLKLVRNFINFGPVDLYPDPTVNYFHVNNERISIQSVTENIVLFTDMLQKLLLADKAPLP